jgi:hypothetical protein
MNFVAAARWGRFNSIDLDGADSFKSTLGPILLGLCTMWNVLAPEKETDALFVGSRVRIPRQPRLEMVWIAEAKCV